jgi:CRP/FNR family transcriptional regulator
MTVRYCRPSALIGAVSLFSPRFVMPGTTQALLPSVVLRLSPRTVLHAAQSDLRVAQAMLEELADRVVTFIEEIPGTAFASVRQRVARHLLDLSSPTHEGRASPDDELVAAVTQRELAEAVGTSREVVVRTLRELREQGVVRTSRDRIVVADPARLVDELMWNTGS